MRRRELRAVNRFSEMARRMSHAEIMDNINEKLKIVYNALIELQPSDKDKKKGVSTEEIAKYLNPEKPKVHTISPRIGELSDLGLIQEVGFGKTDSGRKCALWSPVKSKFQYNINFNYTKDDIICAHERSRGIERTADSVL